MTRRWQPIPVVGALVLAGALVAGCGASAGSHPTIDPDVGTNSPTSTEPTQADRCPDTFGQLQPANGPVSPPVTAPRTLGLPAGVRQALVCFYGPITTASPASPPRLRWSRTLDGVQAGSLLAVVDAKSPGRGDLLGPINCPMDNGSAAIVRFSYAGQPSQDVLVRMTGCRPASSEHGTTMFRTDIVRAVLMLHAPVVEG